LPGFDYALSMYSPAIPAKAKASGTARAPKTDRLHRRRDRGVPAHQDQARTRRLCRKFALPTDADSAALDENLDYEDVKLKILQQEGYDAHDFNLFDDRSSQLWRKPYVDGAVRELTAGDSRTQEQMRQAVEQIMLAAGNSNPDVRYTTRKSHRSRGNVTVDAEIGDESDLLTDMRRNPDDYKE
jgi:hypothetical protein